MVEIGAGAIPVKSRCKNRYALPAFSENKK
jgi:hypothetical protein